MLRDQSQTAWRLGGGYKHIGDILGTYGTYYLDTALTVCHLVDLLGQHLAHLHKWQHFPKSASAFVFPQHAIWVFALPRKLATEFCVSTKTPFRIFVFPPNVKRDFVFPQIFVSALSLDT